VERQIESLLGHAVDFETVPATRVEHSWSQSRGWTLVVRVALPAGERTRSVDVRTCAAGTDVVALTLALILDPDFGGDPSESEQGEEGGEPVVVRDAEAEPARLEGVPEPAPPGVVEPAPPIFDRDLEPRTAPATGGSSSAPRLSLGAAGRLDVGTLPALLVGGGPPIGFRAGGWSAVLGAELLVRAPDTLPTARFPTRYSNRFATAHACRDFDGGTALHFGTCLGAQVGRLEAEERGGLGRAGGGLWAAALAGAELGLGLGDAARAFARLQLAFPLVRHDLALAGAGVVHELPPISAQFQLGAAFDVKDWTPR
jgi:hypothetical protein